MDPVIFIQLALPDVAPLSEFSRRTALLTDSHRFRKHVVLAFCDPAIKKGPGVAGVFNEVPPLNGGWTLEIAVELPDLLPSLEGRSESVVVTKSEKHGNRELCLSNRMSRFHYQDGDVPYHVLLPRQAAWHGHAQVTGEKGEPLSAAEEQLRTVAAMRFQLTGDNTEQAFELAIKGSLSVLFDSINRVLQATRECRSGFVPVSRAVSENSVPSVYVLLLGSARVEGAVLALNGARVSLNPEVLEGDKATKFRQIADSTVPLDDIERLVGEARSSWESGEYEFSFLQAVIAAEIATARTVRAACHQKGVSKKKLDNARKEMTYSWALNVGLPLALEPAIRPPATLIAAMNVARDKRNDLMHEAIFSMNRAELGQLLTDTRSYVDALKVAARTIAQQVHTMSKTPPLFQDDKEADESLVTKSAFFGNFCVATHMRTMWEWFHPYADSDFVEKVRQGVKGLHDHDALGKARTDAYHLFHRCYWEMYVGCALLKQGIKLVPRAQWDKAWGGAGPDLMAEVDQRRVWVECVAPGPGDGADAVPELGDKQVNDVPVQQINLRLLSVFKDKREKYAEYLKKGIVKAEDGYVVAINARGVPLAFLSDDPPWIVRTLYGFGHHAVTYNLVTRAWSEAFLTSQPSITKRNNEVIDTNLFGSGKAAEVSGVIYSAVDAWNPGSNPARGILFVHNSTATGPLPNRWLPESVSYSAIFAENKRTITRADPEPHEPDSAIVPPGA